MTNNTMHHGIDLTIEDLIRQSLKDHKDTETDPATAIAETVSRLFPSQDALSVRMICEENSYRRAIDKRNRDRTAAENEFQRIGQLSLFGDLIPEHSVPKSLIPKSAAEMQEWMRSRAQIETENADEAKRYAETVDRKAKRYQRYADAVDRVIDAIETAGFNPEVISYGEAIQKAETVFDGSGPVSVSQTERPLR